MRVRRAVRLALGGSRPRPSRGERYREDLDTQCLSYGGASGDQSFMAFSTVSSGSGPLALPPVQGSWFNDRRGDDGREAGRPPRPARCGSALEPGWCPVLVCSTSSGRHPTCRSSSWWAALASARRRWSRSGSSTTIGRSHGRRRPANTTIPRSCSPRSSGRSTSSSRSSPARSNSSRASRSTSAACSSPVWSGRWRSGRARSCWSSTTSSGCGDEPVWALVQALADCVPFGSQLVLISRTEPDLALGRMRADRRVHTVGSRRAWRSTAPRPARCSMRPALTSPRHRSTGSGAAPRDGRSGSTLRRSRSRSRTTRSRQPKRSRATTVWSPTTSARSSSRCSLGDRASSCCRRRCSTSSRRRCATRCSNATTRPGCSPTRPVRSSC